MEEKEIKALISLLDDEDKQVVAHVEEKIRSLGKLAIPYLEKEWEASFNPALQARIEEIIHDLQSERLKERLLAWYQGEEKDLLEGMWIVATIQYPDLSLDKLVTQEDYLAGLQISPLGIQND